MKRPTFAMRSMLRTLDGMTGDRTLSSVASRGCTSPAGAKRTLVALEDRGWATEHVNGTYSITSEGQRVLYDESDRLDAEHGIGIAREPQTAARRLGGPNRVKGHPGWYFGLVVRGRDRTQTFDLLNDDGRQILDVVAQAEESKHDVAARAIAEHGIGLEARA